MNQPLKIAIVFDDAMRPGSTTNPFQFVGQHGYYLDTETGSNYIRARVYQPTIARWWSVDPIGFIDGLNLFLYVGDNPIDGIDPSGNASCFCQSKTQTYSYKGGFSTTYVTAKDIRFSATKCSDLDWDKRKGNITGGTSGRYYECVPLNKAGIGTGGTDSKRVAYELALKLSAMCRTKKCCNCEKDAVAIANAIAQKIKSNANWPWYRLPVGRGGWGLVPNQRYKGYWCWDWADLFREAAEGVKSKCFAVELHGSGNAKDGRQHWFIAITGPDGKVTYVDDSFYVKGKFVHDKMPCGKPGDPYSPWGPCSLKGCGLVRNPGMK